MLTRGARGLLVLAMLLGASTAAAQTKMTIATGVDPAEVAAIVVDAVRTGRFWVLTHPTTLGFAQQRWNTIAADGRPTLPGITSPA